MESILNGSDVDTQDTTTDTNASKTVTSSARITPEKYDFEKHLVECLQKCSASTNAVQQERILNIQISDGRIYRCGALLSIFCSMETDIDRMVLPQVQSILRHCPEAAHYCFPQTGRTALHEAISLRESLRPDLVRILVETNPLIVRVRDSETFSLAIDILAGTALMHEERLKYLTRHVDSKGVSLQKVHENMEKIWGCARYLVLDPSLFDQDIPPLHALLACANDVPMSLLEQAIRHHSLTQVDYEGNLPLHMISDLRRQRRGEVDDDDEDGENSLHLLRKILQEHPAATQVRNHAKQLPIDLAINSGRRWETGISILMKAFPLAGLDRRFALRHYPLLLDQLLNRRHCKETVYALLRNNPKDLAILRKIGTEQKQVHADIVN